MSAVFDILSASGGTSTSTMNRTLKPILILIFFDQYDMDVISKRFSVLSLWILPSDDVKPASALISLKIALSPAFLLSSLARGIPRGFLWPTTFQGRSISCSCEKSSALLPIFNLKTPEGCPYWWWLKSQWANRSDTSLWGAEVGSYAWRQQQNSSK